jgi:hypothetical protein
MNSAMKPDEPTTPEDENEAECRFNETLGRLVNTPHKKHEPVGNGREPKPAPKRGA